MNKNLLNMLVCPVTKSKLYYNKVSNELISLPARLAFKIKDDIPVMLESEARQIDHDEYEKFKELFLK
ncbi:MAG: tetraacyldisaccharide 4'-kinase [Gammaproteobacteria bacterium]|nr:tetraacyldisaccharide 4'-kinase [Gammaproteobacteria bacterium]